MCAELSAHKKEKTQKEKINVEACAELLRLRQLLARKEEEMDALLAGAAAADGAAAATQRLEVCLCMSVCVCVVCLSVCV